MAVAYSYGLNAVSIINSRYDLDMKSHTSVIYVDGSTLTKINLLFRSCVRKSGIDLTELTEMFREHLLTKYRYLAQVEYSYHCINLGKLTLVKVD